VYSYCTAACGKREPWAQGGDIPWVRASQDPKVINSVMRDMPFCAELLLSSRVKVVKDWIDEGCPPMFLLWLWPVARSRVSLRPSDVEGLTSVMLSSGHPMLRINVSYGSHRRPCALLLIGLITLRRLLPADIPDLDLR